MARETGIPLEKVTLNLISGDKEILEAYYSTMGWTVAARQIINKYCNMLREKDSQEVKSDVEDLDIELPEEIKQ